MKSSRTIEQIDSEIAALKKERDLLRIVPEAMVTQITAFERYSAGATSSRPVPVAKIGDGAAAQFIVPRIVAHDEEGFDHYLSEEAFLVSWSYVIVKG